MEQILGRGCTSCLDSLILSSIQGEEVVLLGAYRNADNMMVILEYIPSHHIVRRGFKHSW